MAKQMKYPRSFLTGTLLFAAWLPGCGHALASASGGSPGRGQGPLKAAERAYYVDRVDRILEAWRGMTRQAQRQNPAPTDGPPYICLVVDADKKELWVESDGRILPEHQSDLPGGMNWSLYRVSAGGRTPLPPLSRFRLPGVSAQSDQVLLFGQNTFQYIYFSFSSGGTGSGYGSFGVGDVVRGGVSAAPAGPAAGEKTYESLVVSPDDYEKAKASFHPDASIPVAPAVLTKSKAAWLRIEELLYREIEKQVLRHGWQLSDLKIECGPDYTAATAHVHGARKGPLPFLRKPNSVQRELRIDSLGHDVWYVKSGSSPSSPRSAHLDLEFLVCATGSIPEPNQAILLQEGRTRQQERLVVPISKWWVRLPNGATVELVGICENPSAGKPWWGPDGSLLGHAPCSTCERVDLPRDRAAYDIAWRIDPPQEGGLQICSTPEGFWGSYHGQTRDRYGHVIDMGLDIGGYMFDRSREKTTLEFIVRNAKGEAADVVFRNISLVCGKNQGFEVEVVK